MFKYVNKNEVEIEKPINSDDQEKFVKVEVVGKSVKLPFDIVVDKDDLVNKPMKPIAINGMFLYLLGPATSIGKKCYEKCHEKYLEKNERFTEKTGNFGVNLRNSEVKMKLYENHDPKFDNYEEYDEFLNSNLDER